MAAYSQPGLLRKAPRAPIEQLPDTDYEFVENPSSDFFCPVTLELLTEPLQTACCGNHLSKIAANKLQKDGKSCPICKHPHFKTVEDKYMKRKVNNLRVRCPYSNSGCGWEGEVNTHTDHVKSCCKRPWSCDYCSYSSTYDNGPSKHIFNCTKYPLLCPNTCERFSVPRYELEAHLMMCPLQPMPCEYAEFGCSVRVPRKDLVQHMKENQQQHLMDATLFNIRLTQESLAEKDRIIVAKDGIISEKDKIIVEKDGIIAEKEKAVAELTRKVANLELQLRHQSISPALLQPGGGNEDDDISEYFCHKFDVRNVTKCQLIPGGNWYSTMFYSHPSGCNLKLLLKTNGDGTARGKHMSLKLACIVGKNDKMIKWPVQFDIHAQVLNKLGDHTHHIAHGSVEFICSTQPTERLQYSLAILRLIAINELGYNADKNTQYLKDDCLHLKVHLKQLK